MKLTNEKLVKLYKLSLTVTQQQGKALPVKVKVAAIRNCQLLRPFSETYDGIVKGIQTETLEKRGFEKGKQYSDTEIQSMNFAIAQAVENDQVLKNWLEAESTVSVLHTVELDTVLEEANEETSFPLVAALQEVGLLV